MFSGGGVQRPDGGVVEVRPQFRDDLWEGVGGDDEVAGHGDRGRRVWHRPAGASGGRVDAVDVFAAGGEQGLAGVDQVVVFAVVRPASPSAGGVEGVHRAAVKDEEERVAGREDAVDHATIWDLVPPPDPSVLA